MPSQATITHLNTITEQLHALNTVEDENDRYEIAFALLKKTLPFFHINGRSLLHNYRYRELSIDTIYTQWRARRRRIHGSDYNSHHVEYKSSTFTPLRNTMVSSSTVLGEIDKIQTRNDDDPLWSHDFVFGLFQKDSVEPTLVYHIPHHRFKQIIQPLLNAQKDRYCSVSDNGQRKKGRDSFVIRLHMLKDDPEFRRLYCHHAHFEARGFTV